MAVVKYWCLIAMFSPRVSQVRRGFCALIPSLLVMFVSVSSAADTLTPAQALTQRMVALDGMRAAIVQKIYANGVVLEESQGSVALAKPNLFSYLIFCGRTASKRRWDNVQ